jgi:hypothetical protein
MAEPRTPTREEYIDERVEKALSRNRELVPAELADEVRRMLRLGLRTHPNAIALVDRLRPRELAHSDDIVVDVVDVSEGDATDRAAGKPR